MRNTLAFKFVELNLSGIALNKTAELGLPRITQDRGEWSLLVLFRVHLAQRSLLLLASVGLGLAITVAGSAWSAGSPGPKAVVPFTSFAFGDVYRGENISQIFVIRNEGDADLEIKDFEASCGCEVVRSDRVIPPGKEGTATLEVLTVSQSGEISKSATLHTNDPERPSIVFTLVANVLNGNSIRRGKFIGPIFLSPETSAALYTVPGKKAIAEFFVTTDDSPVKVLRVEGGAKHFAPRVEVIEPGRNYKIVVESLAIDASGLYTDRLRVITDHASLPAFTIDLSLRVYSRQ